MTTNNLVVLLLLLILYVVYGNSDCPVNPPSELRHCIPSVDDPHHGLAFTHPDDPTCLCESCRAYTIMVQPCVCMEDGSVIQETKCDHPPDGFFMPCHLNWCTNGFPCKTCMGDLIEMKECTFNEDTVCTCPMHTDQVGETTCQPWPMCQENYGIHRAMILDAETSLYSEIHVCKVCEDGFIQPKSDSYDRCMKEEEDEVFPTMETKTPENEAALLMQCIPSDHDPHLGLLFQHPKDPNCLCDTCRQHMYMIEPCKCMEDGVRIKDTGCDFAPEGFYMPYNLNWCSSPLPCKPCMGDLIELKECTFNSATECGCPMHADLIGETTCQPWPRCPENYGIHREFDESMNFVHICKACEKGFMQPYHNSYGRCIREQPSVTTTAPDNGPNPHIIFATPYEFILYDMVTGQSWRAYEYHRHNKYLDVHIDKAIMYWTGWMSDYEVIKRVQIQVSNSGISESTFSMKVDSVEVLSDLTVDFVEGIAIDCIHDNMYWTDAGLNTISVSNLDGSKHSVVIKDNLTKPRDIVVYPRYGFMFWVNWGLQPKIETAGMNGANRNAIVTTDLMWPTDLAIDYSSNRLFWVDALMHTLSSCDFNGMHRRTIINSKLILPNPFSIAVFEDHVYWTDWNTGSIIKANKLDGSSRSILLTNVTRPMSLKVIHPLMQTKNTENYCGHHNGGCSYLCVAAPRYSEGSARYSCLCPDGKEIMEDGHTCTGQTPIQDGPTTVDPNKTSNHHHRKGWIAGIVILVIILFILGIIMWILYKQGLLTGLLNYLNIHV